MACLRVFFHPETPRPTHSHEAGGPQVLSHWAPGWRRGREGKRGGCVAMATLGAPESRAAPAHPRFGPRRGVGGLSARLPSYPLDQALCSPGRRAGVPSLARSPYPWQRRGRGQGLPGPGQQLPAGAGRPPPHLQGSLCGPQRPRRREDIVRLRRAAAPGWGWGRWRVQQARGGTCSGRPEKPGT